MFFLQLLRPLGARPGEHRLVEELVVHVVHRDQPLLDLRVQVRVVLQLEHERRCDQAERAVAGLLEGFAVQTRLPGQGEMLAEAVALFLELRWMAGEF